MLSGKASRKSRKMVLDSAFVLRILLEYYMREKKHKYLAIDKLFDMAPKKGGKI